MLEGTVALLLGENINKGAVAKAVPLNFMASASGVIVCSLNTPMTEDLITSLKNTGLDVSQVTF